MRKGKRAAVLGCGPAGMFATHALIERGYQVQVLSKKRRSEMFGAQYLHAPIPGLSGFDEPHEIEYRLLGTAEQYRAKVYGNSKAVKFVSPENLVGKHHAWDIRRAYYHAFSRYASLIMDVPDIDGDDVAQIIEDEKGCGTIIVSTIPAQFICINPLHVFGSQAVWAVGDAPERGIFSPLQPDDMTVVCNGQENPSWYRASNVFGYITVEWPEQNKPPISGVARVDKPTATNCNCWEGKVIKLGRFGAWDKSAFSHSAYYKMSQVQP